MKYGVFDSGLGGMTVLKKLIEIMPENDYVYFGDVARVPYGSRSNDTIIKYAKEDAAFLINQKIDAIIIACGTVSAVAHDILKKTFNLPIYSVIDFAVASAAKKTKNNKIGVIGTQATVNSGVFERKIAAVDSQITVTSVACPLFVPLIENGIAYNDEIAVSLATRYMKPIIDSGADTVIMGCTHYPIYTDTLKIVYPDTNYINVGLETALQLSQNNSCSKKGKVELFVSEISQAFCQIADIMGFSVLESDVKIVDVSGQTLN